MKMIPTHAEIVHRIDWSQNRSAIFVNIAQHWCCYATTQTIMSSQFSFSFAAHTKVRSEGQNAHGLVCGSCVHLHFGNGVRQHGTEMDHLPDASHRQELEAHSGDASWSPSRSQAIHDSKILFRADDCGWSHYVHLQGWKRKGRRIE